METTHDDAVRRRRLTLQSAAGWLLGLATAPAAMAREAAAPPYRLLAARHLYATYRPRIYRGKLPPLLYAIAIIETEIDASGHVVSAAVTREPASAKEIGPWIVSLIHAASPFPAPSPAAPTRIREIWLVDRSGRFQLDALTEGQL